MNVHFMSAVKNLVRLMIVVAICLSAQAHAGVVSTQSMVNSYVGSNVSVNAGDSVDKLVVREKLINLGVAPDVVNNRLAAMTPAEIKSLNKNIDELPAGEGILGLAVFVFVLFIVTDAVCVTDIYSFVNCAK